MKHQPRQRIRGRLGRAAFSMLEVVISTFLVGTVMVVAMEVFGAAVAGRANNGSHAQAVLLAEALVDEILDQAYLEPDDAASFGPESGETPSATRRLFDDVDDYHKWFAGPPQSKDGVDLPLAGDWSREVVVHWTTANDTEVNAAGDDGLKRVEVTVKHKGQPAATLSVVVTRARQVLPLPVP